MLMNIRTLTRQAGTSMELELIRDPEAFSLRRDDISFESPIIFSGQLLHTNHGILVLTGTLKTNLIATCARCLQPVHLTIETSLEETYQPKTELLAVGEDQPEETYEYSGYELDVDQALRDNLIPLLPVRLICREDCVGICPACGADRNTSPCDCMAAGKGKFSPFDALKQLL